MGKQNQSATPSRSRPVSTNNPAQEKVNTEATNVASPSRNIPTKRNMSGNKKIFTDLFKLCVAKVIKYEGWDESNEHPETHANKFSTWEHTHPFRTFDKKGDKLTTCTPIGGHFHVVEWEENEDPDAPPQIKKVSGPMVMSKQKVRGRNQSVAVPANDYDFHTHEIEYIRSAQIEVSATNIEAAKVIAVDAQKTAPVQGVTVN